MGRECGIVAGRVYPHIHIKMEIIVKWLFQFETVPSQQAMFLVGRGS
jgi:hypothetical protein